LWPGSNREATPTAGSPTAAHEHKLVNVPLFKPTNELDRVFQVSIVLKALDGALEVIGGVLLLLISPTRITQWAKAVTQHELGTDPHDFIARHILHSAHDFAAGGRTFAVIYLFIHGLTKIVLVVEILRERLWAYKGMVVSDCSSSIRCTESSIGQQLASRY
jgi:uncharacterized membrane protein